VANRPEGTRAEKANFLEAQFEELVVEAKRLGVELEDIQAAIDKHWKRLRSKGGREG